MKRSQINQILTEAHEMMNTLGWTLPPFAYWTTEQMQQQKQHLDHLINSRCGWDITDYGTGNFEQIGLCLLTLRNGLLSDLQHGSGMCYAEKLLISRQDQLSPMHTHILKVEDIINRGGATLIVELYGSDDNGQFAGDQGGQVLIDGICKPYDAGEKIKLEAGQSVTLRPGDWHAFWGEGGDVLIGEVSTVNDDQSDNIFRESIGRFANIQEDEPPLHLLVSDYDQWL